jgi:hypothetical protein
MPASAFPESHPCCLQNLSNSPLNQLTSNLFTISPVLTKRSRLQNQHAQHWLLSLPSCAPPHLLSLRSVAAPLKSWLRLLWSSENTENTRCLQIALSITHFSMTCVCIQMTQCRSSLIDEFHCKTLPLPIIPLQQKKGEYKPNAQTQSW